MPVRRTNVSNPVEALHLHSLAPAAALLLACTKLHLDASQAERIRALLHSEVDWEALIRLGQRHRVMPLLYMSLSTACPDAVPAPILDHFKRRFSVNRFHNLFLTRELVTLLNLFSVHHVQAVPYKGPVLAAHAYGDISLRQFVDLDILVAEGDLSRAKDLLISQGYRLRAPLTASEEYGHLKGDYEYRLVRDDKPIVIGLHWRLAPRYLYFPLEALQVWEHLADISLANATIPSLTQEDLLLLLCVHGTKDRWERLAWVCDIASLIHNHTTMDWSHIVSQATKLRSTRVLLVGVGLAQRLFATALPPHICQRIQHDTIVQTLLGKTQERLFSSQGETATDDPEERFLFYLQARERFQDRLRMYPELMYLRRWLPPRAINQAFWQFSPSFTFLHNILWPLHFLGKCGTSLALRFQHPLAPLE